VNSHERERAVASDPLALIGPRFRRDFGTGARLEITHPWARATSAAQKNGAAYMTIRNHGEERERLIAVRTGEARGAELHASTVTAEGVAQMRAAEALDIPPNGEAKLAPSGVHIMLVGLKGPLLEGVSSPMTLVFERAGEVNVEVEVMSVRANEKIDHDDAHASHAGTEHGSHGAGHQP
jgi:periplasmic copper chaperone A